MENTENKDSFQKIVSASNFSKNADNKSVFFRTLKIVITLAILVPFFSYFTYAILAIIDTHTLPYGVSPAELYRLEVSKAIFICSSLVGLGLYLMTRFVYGKRL